MDETREVAEQFARFPVSVYVLFPRVNPTDNVSTPMYNIPDTLVLAVECSFGGGNVERRGTGVVVYVDVIGSIIREGNWGLRRKRNCVKRGVRV